MKHIYFWRVYVGANDNVQLQLWERGRSFDPSKFGFYKSKIITMHFASVDWIEAMKDVYDYEVAEYHLH